jgi:hypothetical protein
MFGYGFVGIGRTGWNVTAGSPENRGERQLIDANESAQNRFHETGSAWRSSAFSTASTVASNANMTEA